VSIFCGRGLCAGYLWAYIPPMAPQGSIIIHAECACGHRAVLTAQLLGEAPDYFMGFDRLRCSRCGRRGRPASVIRYWSSSAEIGDYQGRSPNT